jgi:hypothetical protein
MNKHRIFLSLTFFEFVILALLVSYFHASVRRNERTLLPEMRMIVRRLELTDLSIWTEARYTRHPSQADFFTPFQDAPSSFEHFPAGSILAPNQTKKSDTTDTR